MIPVVSVIFGWILTSSLAWKKFPAPNKLTFRCGANTGTEADGQQGDTTKSSNKPTFRRTNRISGSDATIGLDLLEPKEILDLSKELLYSGIPEKVLDVYTNYCSILLQKNESSVIMAQTSHATIPIICSGEEKLLVVTAKAMVALGLVSESIAFLAAVNATGVAIGPEGISNLLSDLALSSRTGLEAALSLHPPLLSSPAIDSKWAVALLKGLWMHGLAPRPRLDYELLSNDPAAINKARSAFPEGAEQIQKFVVSFLERYSAHNPKISSKVMSEALRVLFRSAAAAVKDVLDSNYERDEDRTNLARVDAGLTACVAALTRFKVAWDLRVAECLLEEALRIGSLQGVLFVVRQMRSRHIIARTTTFNKVLERFAESGDAESALACVKEVMGPSPFTAPNKDSYYSVLDACLYNPKGLMLAPVVARDMLKLGSMDKRGWDKFLEYCICATGNSSWVDVVHAMSKSGSQPDEHTVVQMMNSFRSVGRPEEALRLYLVQVGVNTAAPEVTRVAKLLPPAGRMSTLALLEYLRSIKNAKASLIVIESMFKARSSSSGASSPCAAYRAHLSKPDVKIFAVAMETCVATKDDQAAFRIFQMLEGLGIAPDRAIYASLIRAFGLRGDTYSGIGVFNELLASFTHVDTASLLALLDVSKTNPTDLRLTIPILEKLLADGADLDLFSKDILMQSFPDARQLGAAFKLMEEQPLPPGCARVPASLTVVSCLVQAVREGDAVGDLIKALVFIGRAGIGLESVTKEYFQVPVIADNSPDSRRHVKILIPNQVRKRSLLDLEVPLDFADNLSASSAATDEYSRLRRYKRERQPNAWSEHLRAIAAATIEEIRNDDLSAYDRKGYLVAEDMIDFKPGNTSRTANLSAEQRRDEREEIIFRPKTRKDSRRKSPKSNKESVGPGTPAVKASSSSR